MTLLAVTVLGHDQPGIVARTTQLLAAAGANLEDSTMTILRGHFAMVLVARVPGDAEATEDALAPLTEDGSLVVSVRQLPEEPTAGPLGPSYLLAVHGADRPGIVSAVTGVVAAVGGNITDLSTRLREDLYVLLAEVDLPPGTDVAEVSRELAEVAARLGVDVSLRPVDTDVL